MSLDRGHGMLSSQRKPYQDDTAPQKRTTARGPERGHYTSAAPPWARGLLAWNHQVIRLSADRGRMAGHLTKAWSPIKLH